MTSALEFVAGHAETRQAMEAVTPLRRIGDVEDVAATVLWLASAAGAVLVLIFTLRQGAGMGISVGDLFLLGTIAAGAIGDVLDGRAANVESYEEAIRRELDPVASAGWGAKVALDRFPRATFAVMRLPVTWRALEKIITGEIAAPSAARGAERHAMKLIEIFARRAGDPGGSYRAVAA